MTLPPELLLHNSLMAGLQIAAKEAASELGLEGYGPVTAMAEALGANRTSAYQQKDRLVQMLIKLATATPGRPPKTQVSASAELERDAAQLTIRVQDFRLEHTDAVIQHATRASYSPSFRRFILGELDVWRHSRAAFAEAVRIPPDTLTDWVQEDQAGLTPSPPARKQPEIPLDASETTRTILETYETWEGSTRSFVRLMSQRLGLLPGQVARVLRICRELPPRPRGGFNYRGSTRELEPGSALVTDGKQVDVELTGSGRRISLNWQAMTDQATGCDTAVVVSSEENADAIRQAFDESVTFLGGVPPEGLIHDNKAPNRETRLKRHVQAAGTIMVAATPNRPQNKSILEGAFSLFEARVGTIRLDDSSIRTLVRSAVREVLRAYVNTTNAVPRPDLGGKSRMAVLRDARPSFAQRAADRAFLRHLKARHERQRQPDWERNILPASRQLVGYVFKFLGLTQHDATGKQQRYLSTFEPAAIRQAAAVVKRGLDSGRIEPEFAHRYLAEVIKSKQETLDLERESEHLLELCQKESQDWVLEERAEFEELRRQCEPEALALALAERATWGSVPVAAVFWTERLLELLEAAEEHIDAVRRHLTRYYEGDRERRLLLLDRITALQWGIL